MTAYSPHKISSGTTAPPNDAPGVSTDVPPECGSPGERRGEREPLTSKLSSHSSYGAEICDTGSVVVPTILSDAEFAKDEDWLPLL